MYLNRAFAIKGFEWYLTCYRTSVNWHIILKGNNTDLFRVPKTTKAEPPPVRWGPVCVCPAGARYLGVHTWLVNRQYRVSCAPVSCVQHPAISSCGPSYTKPLQLYCRAPLYWPPSLMKLPSASFIHTLAPTKRNSIVSFHLLLHPSPSYTCSIRAWPPPHHTGGN